VDSGGRFLNSWGDSRMFPRAHAVTMGPDDTIWLTDVFDHTVRKCTLDGKVLMTIGNSGKPARAMNGSPVVRPREVVIAWVAVCVRTCRTGGPSTRR
jgi:hypothetical protein